MYALSNSVPAPNKGVLRIFETQKPDFFCRLTWSQEQVTSNRNVIHYKSAHRIINTCSRIAISGKSLVDYK